MAKMNETLQWWKDCCNLHDALAARAALVKQALSAPEEEQPRIWQRIEDMESARTLVLTVILAVIFSIPSLFTGVWCYPAFFVSVFIPAIPQRMFSTTLIPANAVVLAIYHHAVALITWQDLYHCVAVTICWVVIRCVRMNVKWDIFQTSLSYERDFRILAESHMMFHKMLGSVYDAWCFCDCDGEIHSSTPQLDLLLCAPGTSLKDDALKGVSLRDLATTDAERKRVENFFSGVACSDATLKLTASLSRVNSTAHQVEVCLSAIALSRRACVDHRLKPACAGEPISGADGDRMIFVAVQVLEAEPHCAVVEAPVVEVQKAVRFQEDMEQESAGTSTQGLACSSGAGSGENSGSLEAFSRTDLRQTCVRNTFVEAAESEADTIFEEARAQLPKRALSAPELLCHTGAESSAGSQEEERSPSARSEAAVVAAATTRSSLPAAWHSQRSGIARGSTHRPCWQSHQSSVSLNSGPAVRRQPSGASAAASVLLSLAGSDWQTSVASEASDEQEWTTEVLVSCQLQDRDLKGVKGAAASINSAIVALQQGHRSVGSCNHAAGECYPCLMETWWHDGKASVPCKFGLFCGRCHEPHSNEHLRELRKQQRRRQAAAAGQKKRVMQRFAR